MWPSSSGTTIRACVRRITVATNREWITRYHGVELSDEFNDLPPEQKIRRFEAAAQLYFDYYLPKIAQLLKGALPHLGVFDWEDRARMLPEIMTSLAASPVRHLKLSSVYWDEDVGIVGPVGLQKWDLQTLDIEMGGRIQSGCPVGNIPAFILSILRLVSPTLQKLAWNGSLETLAGTSPRHTFRGELLHFPKLHTLTTKTVPLADNTVLATFLNRSPVHSLSIGPKTKAFRYLRERGFVPSLEAFHLNGPVPEDMNLSFIQANTQLRSLTTAFALPSTVVGDRLLPILASGFRCLTTLSLTWNAIDIPGISLRLIGSITTLRQLWLSAGEQYGWGHTWEIRHDVLRAALRPLQNLEQLAFSRDSYKHGEDENVENRLERVARYYEQRYLPPGENVDYYLNGGGIDDEILTESADHALARARLHAERELMAWEIWHAQCITQYAWEYARELPKLGWCYFGQLPMKIVDTPGPAGVERNVVPETEIRDSCFTLLRRMWGML